MAKTKGEQIWVWLDDPAFGPLQHIGILSRGDRGSVRFAYEPTWLKHAHAFPLDPELDLTSGEFFPGNSRRLPEAALKTDPQRPVRMSSSFASTTVILLEDSPVLFGTDTSFNSNLPFMSHANLFSSAL